MRKFSATIARALLFVLTVTLSAACGSAATFDYEGLRYRATSPHTAEIIRLPDGIGGGYSGSIAIPDTVWRGRRPYLVTAIGDKAFSFNNKITGVSLPGSLETIGQSAFAGCNWLNVMEMPGNVRAIGGWAFWRCDNLRGVSLPQSLRHIGDAAFDECHMMESADLPDSLETIGRHAFHRCKRMRQVRIPESVRHIGGYAFEECDSLTCFSVSPGNPNYTSLDGVLFSKALDTLIQYPIGRRDSVYVVPRQTMHIGGAAFYPCKALDSVSLPRWLRTVGHLAFSGTGIRSLHLPGSVVSIGRMAFFNCDRLKEIVFPPLLGKIDDAVFHHCDSLESIYISRSVREIEDFSNYQMCLRLAEINVSPENTTFSSVDGVLFDKARETLIKYPVARPDSLYRIPATVTAVARRAFILTERLSEVVLPLALVSIGDEAFYSSGLRSVVIPAAVENIGKEAFLYSHNLVSVTVERPDPLPIHRYTFADKHQAPIPCMLYVPEGAKEAYAGADGWNLLGGVAEIGAETPEAEGNSGAIDAQLPR